MDFSGFQMYYLGNCFHQCALACTIGAEYGINLMPHFKLESMQYGHIAISTFNMLYLKQFLLPCIFLQQFRFS